MEGPSKKGRLIDFFQSMTKEELMEYFESLPEEKFENLETPPTNIWDLPDEILVRIISQNPDWTIQDIERVCAVNKHFNEVLCPQIYEQIWKRQATPQKVRELNELIIKHTGVVDIPVKRKLLAWRLAYVLFRVDQPFHILCSATTLFIRPMQNFDIEDPYLLAVPVINIEYWPPGPNDNVKGTIVIWNDEVKQFWHNDKFNERNGAESQQVVSDTVFKQFAQTFSKSEIDKDSFRIDDITWEQVQLIIFLVFCLAATRGDPVFQVDYADIEENIYEKTKTLYLMGSHICGNCKESKMTMFHERNNVKAVFCGKACQRKFYK